MDTFCTLLVTVANSAVLLKPVWQHKARTVETAIALNPAAHLGECVLRKEFHRSKTTSYKKMFVAAASS